MHRWLDLYKSQTQAQMITTATCLLYYAFDFRTFLHKQFILLTSNVVHVSALSYRKSEDYDYEKGNTDVLNKNKALFEMGK